MPRVVLVLTFLLSLVLDLPLGAEPSAWIPYKTQDGVSVAWRWEKQENLTFRAEFRVTNTRDRALHVSFKPFFVDATGHKWVDGGLSFSLEPRQTKAGEQLRSHELPAWFHAAPVSGGFEALVVTTPAVTSEAGSASAGWATAEESDLLRVSWRSVENAGVAAAQLRFANLSGRKLSVEYRPHFTNTTGQIWLGASRKLVLLPREVREGALSDLEFYPVYHTVDPLSAHDRWLASPYPPAAGGVELVAVSAQ